jgi:hypothetical protein
MPVKIQFSQEYGWNPAKSTLSDSKESKTRVRKHSDEMIATVLYACRGNVTKAANRLGYARGSLVRAIKRSPYLQEAQRDFRGSIVDLSQDVVLDHVQAGDLQAAKFVLDRLGASEGWGGAPQGVTKVAAEVSPDGTVRFAVAQYQTQPGDAAL